MRLASPFGRGGTAESGAGEGLLLAILKIAIDFKAFYITAQQVKEAANFLNSLDDNAMENMYDFKSMRENAVYPLHGRENETGAGSFYEYIYSYLIKLREFFNQTAEKGYAIILYFS